MKSRTWGACLACAAVGFVLSGLVQPQLTGQDTIKDRVPKKWEYTILVHGRNEEKKTLNDYGDEGWELVCVASGQSIFKRPKQ